MPRRCLTFMLLLLVVPIFSCKRCFVNRLTVICALPSSLRNVGVDIKALHVGKLSFTRNFNFKRLCRTARDGKFLTSFVPTCKIMVLGFFRIIGIRLCSISATVAPRKLHAGPRKLQAYPSFNYAINDGISNYDSCFTLIEALVF